MAFPPTTESWVLYISTGETGPTISAQIKLAGDESGGDRSLIDAMLRAGIEAMIHHLENTYPNTMATASIQYNGQLGVDEYPFV